MKKNVLMILLGVFFMGLNTSVFAFESKLEKLEIQVSVQCKMCKDRIEKAMAYEKGVNTFSVDLDKKILSLTYDPKKTSPEKIRQVIAKLGHDADDIPANAKAYEKLPACCKKGSSGCGH